MPKQNKRTTRDRMVDITPTTPRILIVCEGARTEKEYFEQFRVATTIVLGEGMNTLSLVKQTMVRRDEMAQRDPRGPADQVWCVFDLDSFPKQNFDDAIRLAEKENIRVAYSNEAFELWYVLHFDYLQSQNNREQYKTILGTKLGKPYVKNDATIYGILYPRQETAIANAKRLLEEHHLQHLNCSDKKPSTTVHLLVLELKKYVKKV